MQRYLRPRFEALEDRHMLSVLAGTVYSDLNADGAKDAGEPGLAGWTAYLDQSGDGVLENFSTTKGSGTLNATVPDNATTRFYQSVSDLGNIVDLNLRFTLSGLRADAVNLSLTSPAGTTVALIANLTDLGYGFSNTTLDDEAIANITAGTAPYAGTFIPQAALSAFDGQSPNGTWTLTINSDLMATNDGSLANWNLIITTPEQFTTTDANGGYYFEVPAGVYRMRVVPHANWSQTSPTAPPYYLYTLEADTMIAGIDFAEHYTQPQQVIGTAGAPVTAWFGQPVEVPLTYTTTDGDATLAGLGLRIHYDSTKLTYVAATITAADLIDTSDPTTDTVDYDADPSTDRYVLVSFADADAAWPGAVPTTLGTVTFTTRPAIAGETTSVRFTAASVANGYGFVGHPLTLNGASGSLDADGNGTADALTDGILILRYLFDPTGQWNYNDALGTGATRTTREAIADWLDTAPLDVDGNGAADALTDGILALRYMFNPPAFSFTDALGTGATRTTFASIKSFLDDAAS